MILQFTLPCCLEQSKGGADLELRNANLFAGQGTAWQNQKVFLGQSIASNKQGACYPGNVEISGYLLSMEIMLGNLGHFCFIHTRMVLEEIWIVRAMQASQVVCGQKHQWGADSIVIFCKSEKNVAFARSGGKGQNIFRPLLVVVNTPRLFMTGTQW